MFTPRTCLLSLTALAYFALAVRSDPGATPPVAASKKDWAYTAPIKSPLPAVQNKAWPLNAIDAFILARLEETGLEPNQPADKLTLLRRLTFDLTGLPPTRAEQDAFTSDTSPGAYERAVDRLLGSPHYGEKWAQHWLDLVRYAETDGFKADDHRPNAFSYRDYVIQALNSDMPYDRFIRQQIAGDELEPANPEALIATGYQRLMPDEYNAANLEQRRQEILDDVTEVTSLAFMGLTLGCAKCHDHKFDPLLQTDFYRLQAFFAATVQSDERLLASPDEVRQYRARMKQWEESTAPLRAEMDTLVAGKRDEMRQQALTKFREEIQQAVLTAEDKRTPYQQQIAALAQKQIDQAGRDAPARMAADKKKRYQELEAEMAKVAPRPPALPRIMAITDVGVTAPPVHLLAGGDWRKPGEELQPGFPLVFNTPLAASRSEHGDKTPSTRRRSALAAWLTRPDHPLTARVMVNRLWQHHFGRGIVATPNDFGVQGDPPTHPELLDWLAVEFVEAGWSLKHMHRLMVTSATYRQSSDLRRFAASHRRASLEADPDNDLLWRMRRRRLDGESLRDAILLTSRDLNPRMTGPSAKPKLPDKISSYAWKPDANATEQNRRSIYVLAKRNMRYPLFDSFDLPDMHNSCACRPQTTTAPQALMLLNGELTLERAAAWGKALSLTHGDDHCALVTEAIRTAWGRMPQDDEIALSTRFIEKQAGLVGSMETAVADFCHALLNANEFVYVD